jgi:hypothetical protein
LAFGKLGSYNAGCGFRRCSTMNNPDALTSVPAVGARIPIPVGVRPEIHARFWSVVERACEKACAELPTWTFAPDLEDSEDVETSTAPDS